MSNKNNTGLDLYLLAGSCIPEDEGGGQVKGEEEVTVVLPDAAVHPEELRDRTISVRQSAFDFALNKIKDKY
jgi:hypothetical protein